MYLQPCHIATKTFCRNSTVTIMTVSAKLPHLYQVALLNIILTEESDSSPFQQ